MIINTALAKSAGCVNKDKWETPQELFDKLNYEYNFTLDPCCEDNTAKCGKYYTPTTDGLIQDWTNEVVFCNPPYSKGNIDKWMEKCFVEAQKGVKICALIPVSTSSKWFHQYVYGTARIEYIQGRIKFEGAKHSAPFSSMLAFYNM